MVNITTKIICYSLVIVLSIFVLNPFIANGDSMKVFDDGNLFTEQEIIALYNEVSIISDEYDMDIIIVTTDDANGKSSRDYADDYFDYNHFGRGQDLDGIMFLLDMDNREVYISTSGKGIKYLTDERIENIIESVFDSGLSEGDYYNGTKGFISSTKKYLDMGIPGETPKKANKITFVDTIIGILGGGGGASAFYLGTKSKYKMKNPVKPLRFRDNSIINLISDDNKLVDTVVNHRLITKSTTNDSSNKSTTHTSSSGKTHGGGGKKF